MIFKKSLYKRGMEISPFIIDNVMPMGAGGMAHVLIAHEIGKKEKVAIKISKGDHEEALRSEAMILKTLNHPNVVKILPLPIDSKFDLPMMRAIEVKGNPWLFIMEYLEGLPMSAYVRGSKGLPEPLVVKIIEKIASALEHIHGADIAHLDIKTENIVFRYPLKKGQLIDPVIIDFGVAAKLKDIQTDRSSLAFTPPERIEQMQGRIAPEISDIKIEPSKVDVYSLGVVLFEIMTGRLPFGGRNEKGLTTAILNQVHSRPKALRPDMSDQMEQLILRMMNKDPYIRPVPLQIIEEIKNFPEKSKYLDNDIPITFRQ